MSKRYYTGSPLNSRDSMDWAVLTKISQVCFSVQAWCRVVAKEGIKLFNGQTMGFVHLLVCTPTTLKSPLNYALDQDRFAFTSSAAHQARKAH